MKKIYLLLAFLFFSQMHAVDFTVNNINYTGTDSAPYTATVTGNNSFSGAADLSTVTYDGNIYTITAIGDAAFKNCYQLTSVVIGDAVTVIGDDAFYACTGLTSVTIGDSLTSIGDYAFYYCTGLTSVNIPDSVTSIGVAAFYHCISLASVTIGDSVTSIGEAAFINCYNLTSVTIPDSVTSIGAYAFRDCSGLTSVNIPDSVTSIGDFAFGYCYGLTSVTIPDSVTSIGAYAFGYCYGLTSVTVGWTTSSAIPVIYSDVFLNITLSNLTLNIPASTTNLYQAAAVWQDFGNFVEDTPATHLNFDGVNDYVEIPKTFNSDFTLEYLVKTTSVGSTGSQWYQGKSLLDGEVANVVTDLGTSIVGNKLAFGIGAPDTTIFSTSDINDGNWKHIAVSWKQSTGEMKIYINGVLESSGTGSTVSRTASSILRISANINGGNFFNGDMDDVRIWNIVRTASEISESKDCELQGTETGLVAYYKFNQGTNTADNTTVTSLIDATSNANDGILVNFALSGTTSNWEAGSPITTGSTCATLSTSNFEIRNNIKMYPNPATNAITIDIDNLTNVELQIFDLTGKELLSKTLDKATNAIDISQLPNGIYVFKANATEGSTTSKVIKK